MTPGLDLKKQFYSREAFSDIELSCHDLVLTVKLFRDYFPDLPCVLSECGTGCNEDFFGEARTMVTDVCPDMLGMLQRASVVERIRVLKSAAVGGGVCLAIQTSPEARPHKVCGQRAA